MAAMASAWPADADADRAENHWRRTFCQVPMGAIGAQAERGKRSLRRVLRFFRARAAAERLVAAELRALLAAEAAEDAEDAAAPALEQLEERGSSVRRALQQLRAFAEAALQQQLLLATVLEEQVAEPLAALQDASDAYIYTLRGEIATVDGEFAAADTAHKEVRGCAGAGVGDGDRDLRGCAGGGEGKARGRGRKGGERTPARRAPRERRRVSSHPLP